MRNACTATAGWIISERLAGVTHGVTGVTPVNSERSSVLITAEALRLTR